MPLASNQAYINQLMFRLGNRNETTLRTQVVNELAVVKDELENGSFLPWFLETETQLSLVAGQTEISLPAGFRREIEGRRQVLVKVSDSTEYLLRKRRGETIDYLDLNYTDRGTPVRYAILGTVIRFWPTLDTAYTLNFRYVAASDEITDSAGSLNPWLQYAPNLVLGKAGAMIANTIDPAKVAGFNNMAALALRELQTSHEARTHTNFDYSDSDALAEDED